MSSNTFPWVSHHGMTSEQYQNYFDKYTADGYRLVCVSGCGIGADDSYAAIWYKNAGPAFVAHHRMSSDQYQAFFDKYTSEGFILEQVSGYPRGDEANYAAIWNKESGPAFAARHGMSSDEYQKEFDKYLAEGFRLVLVDGYTVNGADTYAAIWVKESGPAFVARHRMSAAEYQSEFDKYTAEGYRLTIVSGYERDGAANYAAIWVKEKGTNWVARHGLTSAEYQKAFDDYTAKGFRLDLVDGYGVNGVIYYAAIWSMPS